MILHTHTYSLTGSSRASDSPLLQHNQTPMSPTRSTSSSGSGSSTSVQPQPYLYPKATSTVTEFKSGEPIFERSLTEMLSLSERYAMYPKRRSPRREMKRDKHLRHQKMVSIEVLGKSGLDDSY